MRGVITLLYEIYVLGLRITYSFVICVFEVRNPFRLQRKIEISEIEYTEDFVSSEKENRVYIEDKRNR